MKKIFEKENRGLLLNTLLLVILFTILFIRRGTTDIYSFSDRIIGNITLENWNTPHLAKQFYFAYLIVFPLGFFLFYKILEKGYHLLDKDFKNLNQTLSLFGLISFFFSLFNPSTSFRFFLPILFSGLTLLSLLLNLFFKKTKVLKASFYTWALLLSIPCALGSSLLVHQVSFLNPINPHMQFLFLYFLAVLGITFLFKKENLNLLSQSFTIFLSSVILHPLFLELYNILNQHHIFLPHKRSLILLIYLSTFLLSILTYYHLKKKKKEKDFNYKKFYYPILLIGISLLYVTPPLVNFIHTDFFESANHGISIFELFRFGKIPLLETFDAHILSNQILGILYGLLNQDILGAVFNLYNSYQIVLFFVLLYFLLKEFMGQDKAFLSLLVLPVLNDTALFFSYFALLCIFTFLRAIKKQTLSSYFLFFGSLVLSCLYRLDIGFAISMSTCLLLVYLIILHPKEYPIKKIVFSLLSTIGSVFIIFLLLCILKGISPLTRAIEFLKLALSNNNWAYSTLGNEENYAYFIFYYLLPIATVLSLFFIFIKKKKNLDRQSLILILFALFYLFNFQRGLIRHSLVENKTTYMIGYSVFYFSFFISTFYKQNHFISILCYSFLLVFFSLLLNLQHDTYYSLTNLAINKELSYQLEDEVYFEKTKRVTLSSDMKKEYKNLKALLQVLLSKNETYIDFTNQTLLYALLGYQNPVYVNQSPGLLSGEYSQQLFLQEIKDFQHVPVALKAKNKKLSDNLDGVPNDYRYYLISEYIYQNYTLLTIVDDYEVWVQNEKYESAKEKLNKNHIQRNKKDVYSQQEFNLKYIPSIWGREKKKLKEKEKLKVTLEKDKISIPLSNKEINKSSGNYLVLEIENKNDLKTLSLKLKGKVHTKGSLIFNVLPGKQIYKIRISTFYAWYFDTINQIEIEKTKGIDIKNIWISKGDTLIEEDSQEDI